MKATRHDDESIGILMREAVALAIERIRQNIASSRLIIWKKAANEIARGEPPSYVTSADILAQRTIYDHLRGIFPGYGFVGEEEELRVPCKDRHGRIFAIDGLDGTNSLVRYLDGKSNEISVGSMVAVAEQGKVIAACVGNVMTGRVISFDPRSNGPVFSELGGLAALPEPAGLLLRFPAKESSPGVKCLLKRDRPLHVRGSIGLSCARVWRGKANGIVLRRGSNDPWDLWPIIGLSEACECKILQVLDGGEKAEVSLPVTVDPVVFDSDILIARPTAKRRVAIRAAR